MINRMLVLVALAGALAAGCQNDNSNRSAHSLSSRQDADGSRYPDGDPSYASWYDSSSKAKPGQGGMDGGAMSTGSEAFIRKAAGDGEMEVEMGRVALSQASSPRVREFAQRMVDDHSRADTELAGLAQARNMSLPSAMDSRHMAKCNDMRSLSGQDFDRKYMSMMVHDHVKAINLFEDQANNGQDSDTREFARRTLPTLHQHLDMAKSICQNMGISSEAMMSTDTDD